MINALERVIGLHVRALQLREQRSELLAANIANADTPGFAARDLDFANILASEKRLTSVSPAVSDAGHIVGAMSGAHQVMYRQPVQPAADDNTVNLQIEKSQFMENAVAYQTQLTFLKGRFGRLLAAVKGE